ncbi:MAG TPA: PstS family phosphate ABC transporter substrate-binding protein, partial [Verrucomicrobiae bacterium]|nr:PstS family phosphate ABC transporter substrate-binding protein [Verrucomicrobiae bacterium]
MKTFQKNTALVLLGLLLTGCPANKDSASVTSTTNTNSDLVVIRGSNTFGEELGPRLISEYKKDHFGVAVDLESKGTGYGFGNLLAGGCDIAAASRSANTNELVMAKNRDIDMNEYVIGAYNVAVIVNSQNPVSNLSKEQVRDIFSGKITNWSAVGGPDAAITIVIRDPISGTYLGFQEIAMEKQPYALEPKTATSYMGIVGLVAKDPNAIGYSSIELCNKPGVKGV